MLKFLKKHRGFSCVNTPLSFDTELAMPNLTERDLNKMNIDQNFKLVYKVNFGDQKKHEKSEL